MNDPAYIDELLQHSQWVRRVAASLVRGQAQVDDVVQQTWVVALQRRPRDPSRLRAWLGAIARNLALNQGRGERRRRQREEASARPETGPSTDELAARAEQQAVLARALTSLPEPYRGTLLLRYVEDLSSVEIARRQGVPAATVRTRHRRGLELLRQQLDVAFDQPRRDWCLGLVPLALSAPKLGWLTTAGTLIPGAAAMSAPQLAGGVAAVLLATLAWTVGPTLFAPDAVDPTIAPPGASPRVVAAPRTQAPVVPPARGGLAEPLTTIQPNAEDLDPAGAEPSRAADSLAGVVQGPSGGPLPGAEVRFAWHDGSIDLLRGEDERTPPVWADERGAFLLSLPDLSHSGQDWRAQTLLVVLHPGHVTTVHGNGLLETGHQDGGALQLAPAGRVTATITDEQGRPLPGVTLGLVRSDPDDPTQLNSGAPRSPERIQRALTTAVRATSDARGRLELDGLAAGTVALRLARDDRGRRRLEDVPIRAGEATDLGPLVLPQGLAISGRCLDLDGGPLARTPVFVQHLEPTPEARRDEDPGRRRTALVTTDAEGRFTAGGLFPGPHRVSVRGDETPFTHREPVPAGSEELVLTVEPAGTVIFSVRDARTGALLPDALAWAELPEGFEELVRARRDGVRLHPRGGQAADLEPGLFRVTGVGREGLELKARAEGHRQVVQTIGPVPPGGTLTADLLLPAALPLEGVVIDDRGQPREDIPVQAAPRSGPAAGSGTVGVRSDAEGRFRIDAAPGDWWVWANAEGDVHTPSFSHTLHDGENAPLVIQLHRAFVVEGQVRDRDGAPVPGAHVAAVPTGAPWTGVEERWQGQPISLRSSVPGEAVVTRADDQGRYELLDLPPGELVLVATRTALELGRPGQPASALDPRPRDAVRLHLGADDGDDGDDSATLAQDLVLVEGGVVRGRVTRRGVAAAGVRVGVVALRPGQARWVVAAETLTDADGVYRLAGLLPGDAALVVRPPAGYPALRPLTLLEQDDQIEDVALDGLTVVGEVVAADTREELAGVQVRCGPFAPAGQEWPPFAGLAENVVGRLRDEVLGDLAAEALTAADGSFLFTNVPEAQLWFEAGREGFLDAWQPEQEVTREDRSLTLELKPAAVLSGAVFGDISGYPGGLRVELIERASGRRAGVSGLSQGGWSLDRVEAGDYELRLVPFEEPTRVLERETVVVQARDELSFRWDLD